MTHSELSIRLRQSEMWSRMTGIYKACYTHTCSRYSIVVWKRKIGLEKWYRQPSVTFPAESNPSIKIRASCSLVHCTSDVNELNRVDIERPMNMWKGKKRRMVSGTGNLSRALSPQDAWFELGLVGQYSGYTACCLFKAPDMSQIWRFDWLFCFCM